MPEPKTDYQDRLRNLSVLAFDVVESLLTDTETPIEIRLNTAFRIVEMCAVDTRKEVGQAVIKNIEENALGIAKNAQSLTNIEEFLSKNNMLPQNGE